MFRGMQGAGRRAAVSSPQLFRIDNAAKWRNCLPFQWRRPIIAWLRSNSTPGLGSGLIAKVLRLLAAAFTLALTTTAAAQPALNGVDMAERAKRAKANDFSDNTLKILRTRSSFCQRCQAGLNFLQPISVLLTVLE